MFLKKSIKIGLIHLHVYVIVFIPVLFEFEEVLRNIAALVLFQVLQHLYFIHEGIFWCLVFHVFALFVGELAPLCFGILLPIIEGKIHCLHGYCIDCCVLKIGAVHITMWSFTYLLNALLVYFHPWDATHYLLSLVWFKLTRF